MTERAIEVGDLCVLVRGHSCTLASRGGIPFVVLGIETPRAGGYMCPTCNTYSHASGENAAVWKRLPNGQIAVHPLSWLKRIPPPSELGIVDERDEVTA